MSPPPQSSLTGRLELTWTNKDQSLLALDEGRSYAWVDPADHRVAVDRLWGPGTWDALVPVVAKQIASWSDDEVEILDRLFYLRVRNGVVEPSRAAKQLVGVTSAPGERWYVVRADDPRAAAAHVGRLVARTCNRVHGWCSTCARDGIHVDGVLASSGRDTASGFIRDVAPENPHPLRVNQP